MANSLSDLLLDRFQRETKAGDDWPELVLAALDGDAAVESLTIATSAQPAPEHAKAQDRLRPAKPRPAYLGGRPATTAANG